LLDTIIFFILIEIQLIDILLDIARSVHRTYA